MTTFSMPRSPSLSIFNPSTLLLLACLAPTSHASTIGKLVWNDEFDTPGLPDPSKWSYDLGGGGWGNGELQFYTGSRPQNARIENGVLLITARLEDTLSTRYGVATTNHFTSARLVTRGKASWTYGRFEARMKLPRGRGMWPAFWMLPSSPNPYGNWPRSGEIDILENYGADLSVMNATIHTYENSTNTATAGHTQAEAPADSFHVYGLDWRPGSISMSVDGIRYFQYLNAGTGSVQWPFDKRFDIILNLAVSGRWGDTVQTQTSNLPQSLSIDWIRIWQDSSIATACCSLRVESTVGGKVVASPAKTVYRPGEKIAIQAIADAGFSFSSWTSGVNSELWSDSLVMDGNTTVDARFAASLELLANGGFERQWDSWRLWNDTTLRPDYQIHEGMGCIRPGVNDPEAWHVQIANGSFAVSASERFEISFVARANRAHPIDFRLSQAHAPFAAVSPSARLVIDTTRRRRSLLLEAGNPDPSARLELNLALDSSEICFDSVSVRKLSSTSTRTPILRPDLRAGWSSSGGELFLTTLQPTRWSLTTVGGKLLGSGFADAAGTHRLGKSGAGVRLLILRCAMDPSASRRTLTIAAP